MTYRLGIIGTNFISDSLCDAVRAAGECTLSAVLSRARETGEAFAKKQNIPLVYTDPAAFFASPDIDAVYIAAPNCFHAPYAIEAMRHGKHVLCEKPVALSREELDRMIQTAMENHVVLLEAMRPVFDPAYDLLRAAIPKLGKLRYVSLEYCQYSSRYDRFKAGIATNAFTPALGNAACMDIGVYPIAVCAMLFGRPQSVHSASIQLAGGMEGMGSVLLTYEDMHAQIVYSKIADSVNPSALLGEMGAITIDKLSTPHAMTLHLRGEAPAALPLSPVDNNIVYEVRRFAALIRTQQWAHPYLSTSEIEMEVLDTIRLQNHILFV